MYFSDFPLFSLPEIFDLRLLCKNAKIILLYWRKGLIKECRSIVSFSMFCSASGKCTCVVVGMIAVEGEP